MSAMLTLPRKQRGEAFQAIASATSTTLSKTVVKGAPAESKTTSDAWHQSSVTIVLAVPQTEVQKIPLRRLLEIIEKALKISNRTADISSLDLDNARITRDSRGHLKVEFSWPATKKASEAKPVSVKIRVAKSRNSPLKSKGGVHSRLARELRSMTGLPAASLASAFGVTREQYQRWVSGRAISDTRHGQLIYLHTIASEVSRKLGTEQAPVWWRTPLASGKTPEQLLSRRLIKAIYDTAAELPDPRPVVDDVELGLRQRDDDWRDEDPPEGIEDQGAWSPYESQVGESP